MRAIRAVVLLILVTVLGGGASLSAERGGSPAPMPPMAGGAPRGSRAIQIGPGDSLSFARKMRSTMNLVAVPPTTAQPKSVEMTVDGKPIGRSSTAPFSVEFDSTTVSDGEHRIKAVGKDAAGKEIWSATAKVEVVNARKATSEGAAPRLTAGPLAPPGSGGFGSRARDRASKLDKVNKPDKANKPDKVSKPDGAPKRIKTGGAAPRGVPAGMSLDKTYSNDVYGVSIRYPGLWTFKDQTATMTPRSEGSFWLVFAAYPIEKANLVVNVRRVKLGAGTDATKFAAYNSYVKKWESKSVLGSPAFATTSRMLRPKPAVVHRLIIIKDGYAWMLNCTDCTRKPPSESLALFESMVATIKAPGP